MNIKEPKIEKFLDKLVVSAVDTSNSIGDKAFKELDIVLDKGHIHRLVSAGALSVAQILSMIVLIAPSLVSKFIVTESLNIYDAVFTKGKRRKLGVMQGPLSALIFLIKDGDIPYIFRKTVTGNNYEDNFTATSKPTNEELQSYYRNGTNLWVSKEKMKELREADKS